jgi:DNA-binding MarR family transcriptional regulator
MSPKRRTMSRPTEPIELLPVVAARLSRLYGKVLSQLGTQLTYRQFRTLDRVTEGHTSLVALAQLSNLTLPTVSENVDNLVRRGLLSRREHPDDRRSVVLEITRLGRNARDEARVALNKVSADLLTDVPERSRATLGRALGSIFDAATAHLERFDNR